MDLPVISRLGILVFSVLVANGGAIEVESVPLTPGPGGKEALFTLLSHEESGVDFINPIDKGHPTKRLYLGAFACGGVAIGDLNGDDRHDRFLTSGPGRTGSISIRVT